MLTGSVQELCHANDKSMEKLKTYITESWDEIRNKVTWSKYSELQGSAILVLVASTIFALVIGAIDWVFKTGLEWFYKEF
jgi:preprotein translocase subunit SecE